MDHDWENDDALDRIINTLGPAVEFGRQLLASMGKDVDEQPGYIDEKQRRKLDLDYSSEEETNVVDDTKNKDGSAESDVDVVEVIYEAVMRPHVEKELEKQTTLLQKHSKRKEEIKAAQLKAEKADKLEPIARHDFPTLLKIIEPLFKPDRERTPKQLIKYLQRSSNKKIVETKLRKSGVTILVFGHIDPVEHLFDTVSEIMDHTDRHIFEHRRFALSFTNQDKINIVMKMYEETLDKGMKGAPLKIYSNDIIQTTLQYMKQKYPEWDRMPLKRAIKRNVTEIYSKN